MDMQALLAPDAGAPLGERRARVLDLLRAAEGPLGVQGVAGRAGLHPNTARFHLDALVGAGLATREPQPRETPGRPSMAYRAAGDGPAGQRRYRLLAEMLTSMITGVMPKPDEAAAEAGREWGRYLAGQPLPYAWPEPGQAIEELAAALGELGFAPGTAAATGGGYRLRLYQCPFREVAESHQDVVCSLHLGLIQGALAQLRAPLTADHLQPFAEPSVCIAELTTGNA